MKTILCYGDSNTYGLKSDLVSRNSSGKTGFRVLCY